MNSSSDAQKEPTEDVGKQAGKEVNRVSKH
jgi:hypothetical protein